MKFFVLKKESLKVAFEKVMIVFINKKILWLKKYQLKRHQNSPHRKKCEKVQEL